MIPVLSVAPGELVLQEIPSVPSTPEAAEVFGAALARTHRSLPSGTAFGVLPGEHPSDEPPLFGPADQPLRMGTGTHDSWGAFCASERLSPVLAALQNRLTAAERDLLEGASDRIADGDFDDAESRSRIHGDLWSGNVLWTPGDEVGRADDVVAVLIDPAAHAGHREDDLAMLQLFGLPHLEAVMAAYERTAPLRSGWEERIPVHQLFYLAVHWLLFGEAYRAPTCAAARATLSL
ncbi:fructosamine kinase family protein [Nesterenkonia flava]